MVIINLQKRHGGGVRLKIMKVTIYQRSFKTVDRVDYRLDYTHILSLTSSLLTECIESIDYPDPYEENENTVPSVVSCVVKVVIFVFYLLFWRTKASAFS